MTGNVRATRHGRERMGTGEGGQDIAPEQIEKALAICRPKACKVDPTRLRFTVGVGTIRQHPEAAGLWGLCVVTGLTGKVITAMWMDWSKAKAGRGEARGGPNEHDNRGTERHDGLRGE